MCIVPRDFELAPLCVLQRSPTVMQLRESLKKRDTTSSKEEEEQEAPSCYLTDTYYYLLGYNNPYIYDQSELMTTERRINQIYMLQVGLGLIKKTKKTETFTPKYATPEKSMVNK